MAKRGSRAIYDERFCRMWEFYLAGSEKSFRVDGHMVFQIQLAKRQDIVPVTRDYIVEREARCAAARPCNPSCVKPPSETAAAEPVPAPSAVRPPRRSRLRGR